MDRIVVGVDGSEGSTKALAWAVEDARRRGDAKVEAVHAWEPPVLVGSPVGTVPPVPVDGPYDDAAHKLLADVLGGVDTSGVTVDQVVLEGQPGAALCERSADATLLVLGSSGHGAPSRIHSRSAAICSSVSFFLGLGGISNERCSTASTSKLSSG